MELERAQGAAEGHSLDDVILEDELERTHTLAARIQRGYFKGKVLRP